MRRRGSSTLWALAAAVAAGGEVVVPQRPVAVASRTATAAASERVVELPPRPRPRDDDGTPRGDLPSPPSSYASATTDGRRLQAETAEAEDDGDPRPSSQHDEDPPAGAGTGAGGGGCDRTLSTGFYDTVGSYGFMFDATSRVPPWLGAAGDDAYGHDDGGDSVVLYRDVEIYGMELYVRNETNVTFEVHVRTNDGTPVTPGGASTYASYRHPAGQTLVSSNWDLVASGVLEGRGIGVGSPIPSTAWMKNVVLPPGTTAGFYVTVVDGPELRYRNTSLTEGTVQSDDGLLGITVGRSWGEYPLQGDGTDVYFSPREFAGAFRYRLRDGELCPSRAPSGMPSLPSKGETMHPTLSPPPTGNVAGNAYAGEEGMCPARGGLETTFDDGTGSHGGLFDVMAKTDLTLTGIDLNIDWNTGPSAHVLIYARKGSWFGHQNNAESWPLLLVNTTLRRPPDFHDRSEDGPFIPTADKVSSAIVPRHRFAPLAMRIGETWSLYVCTSQADYRYTMGSSIGKTYASNPEIRIMEGAGAGDYPPFGGGVPEAGGSEYTFYAPRVFNGRLRYDYAAECASDPPSGVLYTPTPTATPTMTTKVRYTFFVEHSSDKLKSAVTYDMGFGVRAVLDGFLDGGDDILYGYKNKHGLTIEGVVASLVSPSEVGYLCHPDPSDVCSPISVDVTATHLATATTDEVEFALLRQSIRLPRLIDVEGYTIDYVGDRAVETSADIVLSNVPDRLMMDVEREFFEEVARDFLDHIAANRDVGNDSLRIMSVRVDGQEIVSEVLLPADEDAVETSALASNRPGRRLQKNKKNKSNNVRVSVKGKYRPPPELDFGEIVESSINRDRELLEKGLKHRGPPPAQDAANSVDNTTYSNYFDDAEVVAARQIKEEKDPEPLGALNYRVEEEFGLTDPLTLAAMGVGGAIVLLSLTFLLRPHRRRAMCSSGYKDKRAHQSTALVDVGDGKRLVHDGNNLRMSAKNRNMVHGDSFGDSDISYPNIGSDQAACNPMGSHSDANLRWSDFSANGPHGGVDPRPLNGSFTGSYTSGSFTRSQGMHPVPFGPQGRRINSDPPRRLNRVPPPCRFPNHNSMQSSTQSTMQSTMQSSMQSSMRSSMQSSMQASFQSGPMRGGPPPGYRRQSQESSHRSLQSGPMGGPPPPRGMHPGMGNSGRHLMGRGPPRGHPHRRSPRPEYGYR